MCQEHAAVQTGVNSTALAAMQVRTWVALYLVIAVPVACMGRGRCISHTAVHVDGSSEHAERHVGMAAEQ